MAILEHHAREDDLLPNAARWCAYDATTHAAPDITICEFTARPSLADYHLYIDTEDAGVSVSKKQGITRHELYAYYALSVRTGRRAPWSGLYVSEP